MTTLPLLKEVLSPALVRALGYALLHSLWQGGVLALVLAGVLPLLRRHRAEVRYAVAAGALASLVLVAGLTLGVYYQSPAPAATELLAGAASPARALAAPVAPASAGPVALVARVAAGPAVATAPLGWLRANAAQLEAYLPLVVVAWLLGLVLMSGRLAGGVLYASRLRRAGAHALGAEWQQRLAVLARRAGLRQPVALLESARVAGPLVLGHLRPVILLPLGAVAGLSPALLEALLAHELAHIVRRDYLLNLGLAVAEVLFFYHPAVWFMASCLRAERENCCDDQAAALCGGDHLRVARALAALAELEAATTAAPRLALAAAGSGGRGSLLARVRRLALGRPQAPSVSERLLAGSLTLLGLLGLSTGGVLAARPTQTAPADTVRRRVAAAPAVSAAPVVPAAPAAPAQAAGDMQAELVSPEPVVRVWPLRQLPPRRGGVGTVVIEKDKKGRVVSLTVNGQPVETAAAGKKARHSKQVRTVEVLTVPGQPGRFEQPERPEMPELPELPERPKTHSFSFSFSPDAASRDALRAAQRGLAEAMRSADLNDEQRQEMQRELNQLQAQLGRQQNELRKQFRTFHFETNGAAASRPRDPRFYIKDGKLKFDKHRATGEEAARQADHDAEQADRDVEQADRDAEQADRDAEQADRDAARTDAATRRAELRARLAADAAELRALDRGGRATPPRAPRPPRAPLAPLAPMGPQVPAPPAPPAAPNTAKLREALHKDGLLKNDKHFSFELSDGGGRIDGQALSPAQVVKYRQLLGFPATQSKGSKTDFNITVDER